jgi:hypothetical protein
MADLSASTEPKETTHFRITFVVQQLGAHLEQGRDFRFDFNKPHRAVVPQKENSKAFRRRPRLFQVKALELN